MHLPSYQGKTDPYNLCLCDKDEKGSLLQKALPTTTPFPHAPPNCLTLGANWDTYLKPSGFKPQQRSSSSDCIAVEEYVE